MMRMMCALATSLEQPLSTWISTVYIVLHVEWRLDDSCRNRVQATMLMSYAMSSPSRNRMLLFVDQTQFKLHVKLAPIQDQTFQNWNIVLYVYMWTNREKYSVAGWHNLAPPKGDSETSFLRSWSARGMERMVTRQVCWMFRGQVGTCDNRFWGSDLQWQQSEVQFRSDFSSNLAVF